jgi:hypothetical protein
MLLGAADAATYQSIAKVLWGLDPMELPFWETVLAKYGKEAFLDLIDAKYSE